MISSLTQDLRADLAHCTQLLSAVERERDAFTTETEPRSPIEFYQARQELFPRLADSVHKLKSHRAAWHSLPGDQRSCQQEVPALLREHQDLILKIIVLERENERALLRRGLVAATSSSGANRRHPHGGAEPCARGASRS
jgi:hypothetical protein